MEDAVAILLGAKTIAVVGISDRPDRPSYDVASYLIRHGFTIIPINPNLQKMEWRGIKAYPTLSDAASDGKKIEVVDIFRKSEDVTPIVEEAISIRAKGIWMQMGIVNDEAAKKAKAAGLIVVMDKCMKIEHMGRGI